MTDEEEEDRGGIGYSSSWIRPAIVDDKDCDHEDNDKDELVISH